MAKSTTCQLAVNAPVTPMSHDTGRNPDLIPEKFRRGLDPEWIELWSSHGSKVIPASTVTIKEFRKDPQKYSFTYPTWRGPEVHQVQDIAVPVSFPRGEITCRIYTPEGAGPFPVHANMHGGGWVLRGLTSEQSWCRQVCNNVGMVVVDKGYRLAPELPFPTDIYDCWDVIKWIIDQAKTLNIKPSSISIGGLSAGGHMAAVLSHFARDEGLRLKLQLLTVPATDMRYCPLEPDGEVTSDYQSVVDLADMPWGPLARESWFLNYFIGEDPVMRTQRLNDWRMTPVLAPNFSNLAPALIITAEFDVERDEGEYYGRLLQEAGNHVVVRRFTGVPHAFAHYNCPERGLSKARQYVDYTCLMLRQAHLDHHSG
ncbi:hypothetical protein ONS95_011070 [Cadophora gregata]|uniref:uncharacterized protein n=1 Tax=Cadophora gregata TaxID=51156 RepID=UPI0026DB0C41|nr:uncharacterized protein ONS95_011070 [Cadophora gregata]KAK0119632.1 hypothetical protein ONS95_011070 [Cadophora gregata]KAK0120667.1 hypothetical protein ONS96_010869 [Cadophora gregata f. sp. sojae]